jgi:integrase
MKLTLSALHNARPGATLPDASVEGLRYRVMRSGRIYAELRHRANGKWTSEPLGRVDVEDRYADLLDEAEDIDEHGVRYLAFQPTLDDVLEPWRAAARELRRRLRRGEDLRGENTLGTALERFLRHAGGKPKSQHERERYLRRDWQMLHARPLTAVTRQEVAGHLLAMREERGAVSVNRARMALSGFYSWCIAHGLAEHNPVAHTYAAPEPSRDRVLSLVEMRRVYSAAGQLGEFGVIVRLLQLSAARCQEVGSMQWQEVDLERSTWTLPPGRSKSSRPQVRPLSEAAVDLLLSVPTRRQWLFGRQGFTSWGYGKRKLDALVRLAPYRLHDLRRSAATLMAEELDVPDRVISALLGHTSGGKVFRTYNRAEHLAAQRQAAEGWAALLLG